MAGVLDALLEGFQPDSGPQVLDGRLRPGDRVRVKTRAKGTDALVGRLVRPSDAKPDTHAIVAPEGGGAHVEAPVKSIELDTPERRAREIASSMEPGEGAVPSVRDGKVTVRKGPGGVVPGRRVQEGVGMLLEGFAPGVAAPGETAAQSMKRGAAEVAAAKTALAGWNANLHPRSVGGRFSYTSGGKRAHVSSPSGSYVTAGAHGAFVTSLQRQLGISADGVYGPQTRAAVLKFQANHGLAQDGVVGRQTLAALRGQKGAAKLAPGAIASRSARVVKHKPKLPVRVGGGVVVGKP